jgi:ribosomal protein S12 methylthiotransferase
MRKVGMLSLGCPRNLVDAESALGKLVKKGWQVVDIEKADLAIINTCAFIDEAKQESINAILDLVELKKKGKIKKIVVAGCLPQRYRESLRAELPEVDSFTGNPALDQGLSRFAITPRHYAYLKICESCLNNCSFCVIPKIKGKFTSLDSAAVLKRVVLLQKQGISELNIIGQDIAGYGMDLYGKRLLPELLRRIVKEAKRIGWIRLLYLYPDAIVNELLEVMAAEPRICKYIDLPVQHINGRILKLMNRRTTDKDIRCLIDKIRKKIPEAAIRTSLIVGFPSETEAEFAELLGFLKEVKFERLGAFTYSREEGTPAYGMPGQLPEKVKSERFNRVMSAQKIVSEENNRKFLGKTIEVLIDEKGKGDYLGRSQHDAPEVDGTVYLKSGRRLKPGDFVKVKITDTLEYDLVGEDTK